jgi:formate dehydrogenase major subunit
LGRGGATDGPHGLVHTDNIVIMGSNMAEAHPVGFQWVIEAKHRGARVIHIDPHFTRTSALADEYVPIRAGSDIAFLGGVINYILTEEKYFREYVVAYTNASFLVDESFRDTEDNDGLFSGFNPETAGYDHRSWQYASAGPPPQPQEENEQDEQAGAHASGAGGPPLSGVSAGVERDETLQHPRCVFQILKRHFARYTPEFVEEVCGTSREQFLSVCEAWTAASGRERTGALIYSVGWTQHSVGAQYIRAGSIVQLLLGNIGRPGGGILALRGHASIQGCTDIPTLFNLLPGYLPMATPATGDLTSYVGAIRSRKQKGFWYNADTYIVSLLKEYWGEHAQPDNDFCFDHLPRINGDHGVFRFTMDMLDGKVPGYFLFGQNPAVGLSNGRLARLAMAQLDWLVVRDLVMVESATFWKDSPEIETGEIDPATCKTEVFFFPAASHVEKEGTFTQTERMLQWREKAVEPTGDQTSELWFAYHLGRILRDRLAASTDPRDLPLQQLSWDYAKEHGHEDELWGEPSAEDVLRRINGYHLDPDTGERGKLVGDYRDLRADGSTSSGCWIYSGVFKGGVNLSHRRGEGPDGKWGWVWPLDRRILYSRASADPQGRPWSERKKLVWWDEDVRRWVGDDIPDFPDDLPPGYEPPADAVGPAALRGDDAFVLQADGKAWLFAPSGVVDGPLPTHYEPDESPVRNPLHGPRANPARRHYIGALNPANPAGDRTVFPFVLTASRLTEHLTAGGMSRWLPFLAELQPELFVEVSPELAAARGLTHNEWCHVITSRTAVQAKVVVTQRIRPLRVQGQTVHQVWMPYHFGPGGLATGDVMNDLLGIVVDPNVNIQESKVATCDVRPGPRPTGPALRAYVEDYRRRAGIGAGGPPSDTAAQRTRPTSVSEEGS